MREYAIRKSDAKEGAERGFEKVGDTDLLHSDFLVACVDSGIYVDIATSDPDDYTTAIYGTFEIGLELVTRLIEDRGDACGLYALMCLVHAHSLLRSIMSVGGDSVSGDMILMAEKLDTLLDDCDIEYYVYRCVNGIDEEGE